MKNSKIFILKPKHSTHLCSQTVVIIYDGSNRDIATEDFRGFDMKAVTAAGNLTAKSAVIPVQRVVLIIRCKNIHIHVHNRKQVY